MGMKITSESLNRTLQMLDTAEREITEVVSSAFAEAGEFIVEKVRNGEMSNWMDVSGSLRSSIGGVVCSRGHIVKMFGFEAVLNGSGGADKGREMARSLAAEYSMYDNVLIIVAGEEYAVYVEAVDGKVVLSAAYLYIEKQMPALLRNKIRNVLRKYEG